MTSSSRCRIVYFRQSIVAFCLLITLLLSLFPSSLSWSQQPDKDMIQEIQTLLHDLGYNPGPLDGIMGKRTRTAIQAFQQDQQLQVDGKASPELLRILIQEKQRREHPILPTPTPTPIPTPRVTPTLFPQPTPTPVPQSFPEDTPRPQGMSRHTKIAIGAAAAVAGVVLLAGDGNGEGDGGNGSYNFNGTWYFEEYVTEDRYGIAGVGSVASNSVEIEQDGSSCTLTIPRLGWVYSGNCDSSAKTLTVSRTEDSVTHTYFGYGTDEYMMSISSEMSSGGVVYVRMEGSATLQSRGSSKARTGNGQLQEVFEKVQAVLQ